MPELPEVETVCAGLRQKIEGAHITKVIKNRPNLRFPFPRGLKKLEQAKVYSITRRAKYICMNLDNNKTLVIHLGMSGRMTIDDTYEEKKHDHFLLYFNNKQIAVLNDPRRFGIVDIANTDALEQHKLFAHLGPEPLEKEFSTKYLTQTLQNKKVAIKLAIMDQKVVVGVGNIYACEALYLARIHPERPANSLTKEEVALLVKSIKQTLKKAIKAGGSSLRDYVQTDGTLGYFQHQWLVYGKEGEKCKQCTCKQGIERLTQGGRSTFYCGKKQK